MALLRAEGSEEEALLADLGPLGGDGRGSPP